MWLGPSYLPPRACFVSVREKAVLFDHAHTYQSSSVACAGDVCLASSAPVCVDGFSMTSLDCGAIETRFLKPASSCDIRLNAGLLVLDLDSPRIKKAIKRNKRRQGWSLSCRRSCTSWARRLSFAKLPATIAQPPLSPETRMVLDSLELVPVGNDAATHFGGLPAVCKLECQCLT